MSDDVRTKLPRWQSHKRVRADRITAVRFVPTDDPKKTLAVLTLACGVEVKPGRKLETNGRLLEDGYYVLYDYGYESWSPAETFRDGYKEIPVAVDSASDACVVNNVMRHEYRVLSDDEKRRMQAVKDHGLAFVELLHSVGGTPADGERMASRELSLAQTKIEEAVMWAVKHVTR